MVKALRKTIRKIILESASRAKTIADLPAGCKISLEGDASGCSIDVMVPESEWAAARFEVVRTNNKSVHMLGAAYIDHSSMEGFGPLFSDLAMEYTTWMNGKWLSMDRMSASEDAQKLWQYYKDHRLGVDVTGMQLDDKFNTLTKKKSDNINSAMADEVMGEYGSPYWNLSKADQLEYRKEFYRTNALMWAFKKKPDIIRQLQKMPDVFTMNQR